MTYIGEIFGEPMFGQSKLKLFGDGYEGFSIIKCSLWTTGMELIESFINEKNDEYVVKPNPGATLEERVILGRFISGMEAHGGTDIEFYKDDFLRGKIDFDEDKLPKLMKMVEIAYTSYGVK
jgi:hypothetical protein